MAEGGSYGARPSRLQLSKVDPHILAGIKDLWKRPKTWDESQEEFAYGRLIYYGNEDANGTEYGYAHAKMPDGSRRDVFLHKNSLARQEYAEILKARLALGEEIFLSFLYIPSSKKAGQYEATYIDIVEKSKEAEVRNYCTRRRIRTDNQLPTSQTASSIDPVITNNPGFSTSFANVAVESEHYQRQTRKTLLPLPILPHRVTASPAFHSHSSPLPNRAAAAPLPLPVPTPRGFPETLPRLGLPSTFASGQIDALASLRSPLQQEQSGQQQRNGLSTTPAAPPAPYSIGQVPPAPYPIGQVPPAPYQIGLVPNSMAGYCENGPRFEFLPQDFSVPPPCLHPPNVTFLPIPPHLFAIPVGNAATKWPPSGFCANPPQNAIVQKPGISGPGQLEIPDVEARVHRMDWNDENVGAKKSKPEILPENLQSESRPGFSSLERPSNGTNQILTIPPLPLATRPPPPPPILEPHEEDYFKGIPLSDECKKKLTKSIKAIDNTRPLKRKTLAKGVPDSCPLCEYVEPRKKLVLLMVHVLQTHVLRKAQGGEKLRYECAICARNFELKWPAAFCTLNCGGAFADFGKQE